MRSPHANSARVHAAGRVLSVPCECVKGGFADYPKSQEREVTMKGRFIVVAAVALAPPVGLAAQYPPGQQSSPNVHVEYHIPMVGGMDTRIDQEPSRPFVYFSHRTPAGFHIMSIKDPKKASIIYSWQIETPELVQGSSTGVMLFKLKNRYYSIASMQLGQNGPASDVVGVVHDVTSLPDTTNVKE